MKNIFQIIIILLISQILIGQEDQIKFDKVEVIKEFSAQIGNFNKISIEPKLPIFDLDSRRYKYNVRALTMKLDYEKPTIRPLALPDIKQSPINKYYLKLGYGIPKLIDVELSLGLLKNNLNSNISIKHISSDNSANVKDQKNSKTSIDFSFFNRKNELELEYGIEGGIDASYYYLYGTEANKIDSFSTNENKRRYISGRFLAFVKKHELFDNFNNKTELGYSFLQLNTNKTFENTIDLKNTSDYRFSNYASLELPIVANFLTSSNVYLFRTTPHFKYSTRLINFKAGGDIGKSQDLNFIYPFGEISSNLFNNFIEIFVSAKNQIYNNSNYLKSRKNPFMNFNNDSISTSVYNNYSAGVRNSLEGAKIEFIASYQNIKNKLLFVPSNQDNRTFNTIYDSGKNIKLEANISYQIIPQLEVSGNMTKNIYEMDNEAKAWFNPDLTANFTTKTYLLDKKLSITGELFFATASWYKDLNGNKKKLSTLFDLGGNVSYKFLKSSQIYFQINNIFAQKYQKWYQYPNHGINLIGGLKLNF